MTNNGVGYGSSEIINFDRQPLIELSKTVDAQLTPIVNDGMDLVNMLNMMIPTKKDKLPNTFDKFKQVYLNEF